MEKDKQAILISMISRLMDQTPIQNIIAERVRNITQNRAQFCAVFCPCNKYGSLDEYRKLCNGGYGNEDMCAKHLNTWLTDGENLEVLAQNIMKESMIKEAMRHSKISKELYKQQRK